MFCYQCQETVKNTACTIKGVCGKNEGTANLQDLLINLLQDASVYAESARTGFDRQQGEFVYRALFATITNANFDDDAIVELIRHQRRCRVCRARRCAGFL